LVRESQGKEKSDKTNPGKVTENESGTAILEAQ